MEAAMAVIFELLPYVLLTGLLALVVACLPKNTAERKAPRGVSAQCYRWDDNSTHHD
jgi:hypothetical protein